VDAGYIAAAARRSSVNPAYIWGTKPHTVHYAVMCIGLAPESHRTGLRTGHRYRRNNGGDRYCGKWRNERSARTGTEQAREDTARHRRPRRTRETLLLCGSGKPPTLDPEVRSARTPAEY